MALYVYERFTGDEPLAMAIYLRPDTMEAALAALAERPLTLLAGGTDFYPARVGRTVTEDVLDLGALADLRGISEQPSHWRIGAATTWTEIIEARLPPMFDALKLAAREVGGRQIQNLGTIAGNLCNASPAADGIPPLLALDASLVLASTGQTRTIALLDFVQGNRRTARRPCELVSAILVPKPSNPTVSDFLKLGARRYLVISIAMAAGILEMGSGRVSAARLAVGACSEAAQRLCLLERTLVGQPLEADLAAMVEREHLAGLQPIDDVRATADYRTDAVEILLRRLLQRLANAARAEACRG